MKKVTSKAYFGTICFIVVLLLPVYPHSHAAQSTSVKFALIADKAFNLHESPLVSLLEVELSQKDDIQLLERAQIRQVLEEQELSLTGLLQRNRAIQIGQLLRVDAFVLLSIEDSAQEKQNQKRLLRVRVTETTHGLRLLDTFEELDSAKLEEIVERITEKVTAIVPKMTLPPGEAIAVGIVDIHRVQLGERYQWLARTLPAMLSVRLCKEPRIIMLEREDLKILHDEKLLAEGEDTEFWGSAVLVEGYLRRRGGEDVEIKLSLRRASGEEMPIFTAPVEPNEPLEAVEKATNNIIQELLNAPPSTSWQTEQEAEEFFRQGELLKNHRRHEGALALLETAHALQPHNFFYTAAVFGNEWGARTLEKGSYYVDLELAEVVSLLVWQIQNEYQNGDIRRSLQAGGIPRQLALGWKLKDYFMNPASVSTEKIRNINRRSRKIWAESVGKAIEFVKCTKQGLLPRWCCRWPMSLAWASSDEPEEVIENIRKTCSEYIMPPVSGGKYESAYNRLYNARIFLLFPEVYPLTVDRIGKTQLSDSAEEMKKRWINYLNDLTKVDDPLVKFFSYVAQSSQYPRESIQTKNSCTSALTILLNELKSPNEPMDDLGKLFIREAMMMALNESDFWRDPKEPITTLRKIYDPLIEKNDVRNVALWSWTISKHSWLWLDVDDIMMAKHHVQLLERIVAVLQVSKDGNEIAAMNRMKSLLVKLRNKFPQIQSYQTSKTIIVRMLLDKRDWPQKNSFKYVKLLLQDNVLWVAFAEPGLGLAGIDLAEKVSTSVWQTSCGNGTALYANLKGKKLSGSVTGLAIGHDACYVAVRDIGLVKFPGMLTKSKEFFRPVQILTEENGLPSVSITGMVGVEQKLWVAYGGSERESGLIIYEPKTGNFDTVFCSTLPGVPPFSGGKSYALSFLTHGPENQLFFIMGERGFDSQVTIREQWWGFWKIDMTTREAKFLWRDDNNPMVLEAIRDSGQSWWLEDLFSLTEFDPYSEKARFILGRINADAPWATTILKPTDPMPELQRDLFVPESSVEGFRLGHLSNGSISLRTAAVYDNELWARSGEEDIIIIRKGNGLEDAKIIDNNILNGDKVLRFFSTPYGLIAIGEGAVGLIETKISEK